MENIVVEKMEQKFKTFLEVTAVLNKHGIIPILYGSIGLYRVVEIQDEVDDIDITIPNENLINKFDDLEKIMKEMNFSRDPDYKHEFLRDDDCVGFEQENELIEWGIDTHNLKVIKINGAQFKELSASDYLNVYTRTLQRWEKKFLSMQKKVSVLQEKVNNNK